MDTSKFVAKLILMAFCWLESLTKHFGTFLRRFWQVWSTYISDTLLLLHLERKQSKLSNEPSLVLIKTLQNFPELKMFPSAKPELFSDWFQNLSTVRKSHNQGHHFSAKIRQLRYKRAVFQKLAGNFKNRHLKKVSWHFWFIQNILSKLPHLKKFFWSFTKKQLNSLQRGAPRNYFGRYLRDFLSESCALLTFYAFEFCERNACPQFWNAGSIHKCHKSGNVWLKNDRNRLSRKLMSLVMVIWIISL